jgi:ABC-2 type transport system ATP-binding protein
VISFIGITQHYGVRAILRDIDLRVESGQLVALMGPNGMGKTTLLRVAAGLLNPIDGYVEINGLRRRSCVDNELTIRRQVAYLPDHPWLPMNMTGREFLAGVGRLYQVGVGRLIDHIDRLFTLFDLGDKGDSPIRAYSNGQQKKIAICAALVADASVLLLDEPFTGGLDPSGILALRRVLGALADRGDVTILMATQVPELAEKLAHRVAVLREGELIAYESPGGLREMAKCDGPLGEVLEHLTHPETLSRIETYFAEAPQR